MAIADETVVYFKTFAEQKLIFNQNMVKSMPLPTLKKMKYGEPHSYFVQFPFATKSNA